MLPPHFKYKDREFFQQVLKKEKSNEIKSSARETKEKKIPKEAKKGIPTQNPTSFDYPGFECRSSNVIIKYQVFF